MRFLVYRCFVLTPLLATSGLLAEPRPVAPAERRAVELLVAYCERGPGAVPFDPSSAWARLTPQETSAELEARLGPPCAGEWQLQTSLDPRSAMFSVEFPSGIDDAVAFEFTGDPAPRLLAVRLLAEIGATQTSTAPPGAANGSLLLLLVLLLAALAGAVGLLAAAARARPSRVPVLACAAAGWVVGAVLVACGHERERAGGVERPAAIGDQPSLAQHLELRRTLLAERGETAAPLAAGDPPAGETPDVVWRVQWAMLYEGPEAARAALARLPATSTNAAVELLRARVAYLLADEDGAYAGYARAISRLPNHDGVQYEAAVAFHTLGYEERARRTLEELAARGSRQADVYVSLAELAVLDGSIPRAERLLEQAMRLRPIERGRLLDNGLLSPLVRPGSRIYPLLALDRVAEPVLPPPRPPAGEADLGAARSVLEGATLRIALGGTASAASPEGSLVVPGGAALGRRDSESVPVETTERARVLRLLADQQRLIAQARAPGALARARLRADLEAAASVLADQRRWRELIELTEPLVGQIGKIETRVLQLRALALDQLGRSDESIGLLARLVKHVLTHERRDPGLLYQLADLLAQAGHHDTAVRLIERASAQLPTLYAGDRVRQIRLEQRLLEAFEDVESRHFLVRYPRGKGALVPQVVEILEAERARLAGLIPAVAGAPRMEVQLMSFDDFSQLYGGSVEVVGIYDGRVRVPLADARSFPPELVAILTHELAHAMIAQATGNQAPKWLHEGLAQLAEMEEHRLNPMPDYLESGRYLAFPVVEAVLQGFPNAALVAAAYDEALWTACYLQSVHGQRGIHALLAAFRDGLSTDDALRRATGGGSLELDRALRAWWLGDAPREWRSPVVRYVAGKPAAPTPGERPALKLRRWWQS